VAVESTVIEITAAGTVSESHRLPYYSFSEKEIETLIMQS